jgi:hypothetical protein
MAPLPLDELSGYCLFSICRANLAAWIYPSDITWLLAGQQLPDQIKCLIIGQRLTQ